MPLMKGGELIAQTLVQEGVPYVFGICGHGNVGILDALYDVRDKLKLISPRHEQCAGHMADAYFRVKHRPVATLTSTGTSTTRPISRRCCGRWSSARSSRAASTCCRWRCATASTPWSPAAPAR